MSRISPTLLCSDGDAGALSVPSLLSRHEIFGRTYAPVSSSAAGDIDVSNGTAVLRPIETLVVDNFNSNSADKTDEEAIETVDKFRFKIKKSDLLRAIGRGEGVVARQEEKGASSTQLQLDANFVALLSKAGSEGLDSKVIRLDMHAESLRNSVAAVESDDIERLIEPREKEDVSSSVDDNDFSDDAMMDSFNGMQTQFMVDEGSFELLQRADALDFDAEDSQFLLLPSDDSEDFSSDEDDSDDTKDEDDDLAEMPSFRRNKWMEEESAPSKPLVRELRPLRELIPIANTGSITPDSPRYFSPLVSSPSPLFSRISLSLDQDAKDSWFGTIAFSGLGLACGLVIQLLNAFLYSLLSRTIISTRKSISRSEVLFKALWRSYPTMIILCILATLMKVIIVLLFILKLS